jgi:hypothetical protein
VSGDGQSAYAAVISSDAVTRFDRDPTTGALTFQDCITSSSNVTGCTQTPDAAALGADTSLDVLVDVAVAADGESVYAVGTQDTVARFDRNPTTGALAFQDCITADTAVAGCEQLLGSGPDGGDTPLDLLRSVAVSADGESVYTASENSDALAWFDRDAATGELEFQACITSDLGVGDCDQIPGAAANGVSTGLDRLVSVAISDEGENVYTASSQSDAVARFDRDTNTGELTYQDCITSSTGVSGVLCDHIPNPTGQGVNTGLDALRSVAVSRGSVYTASFAGDAVARFDRGAGGQLSYQDCITSDTSVDCDTMTDDAVASGTDTGLSGLQEVAVTDDGRSAYTASVDGDAVARFDRDGPTGALTYQVCITANSDVSGCAEIPDAASGGTDTALDVLRSVAVSADGRSVYAGSEGGAAVARFDRELETVTPPGPSPPGPGPPGAGPTADTTPPSITLKGKKTQKGAKLVKVKVTSDEAAALDGTGTIKVPKTKAGESVARAAKKKRKRFKLKGDGKPIAAGGTQTLKLRLKKRAKGLTNRAHAQGKKAKAKVTVKATDAAGNEASANRKVKLKRKGTRR